MDHVHTASCDADNCFREKMRYMREHGLSLTTPKMVAGVSFYDTTIKEQQDRMRAEAAANGWESRQKNPLYDK